MGNIINIDHSGNVSTEAAAWAVKLDGRKLSPEEFALFKTWYAQSKAHGDAFQKAALIWGKLDILTEAPLLPPSVPTKSRRDVFWGWVSRNILQPQISIAFALIILIGVSFGLLNSGSNDYTPVIYTTSIGASKTVDLADGSRILLNTDSQVEVQYTEKRRILRLLKGEAHFKVAHNKSRPFDVYAGTNIVRAVGTAFTVELKSSFVEVTVTEGQVQLATLTTKDGGDETLYETPLALVSSGQSAEFSDKIKKLSSIDPEEIERRLAWQTGILIFNGEALEDVVQEISRYTKTKIIISDPEIRKIKIGGYYKTTETEAMLQALETSFGVSVRRVNKNLVYLSRSSGS